MELANQSNNIFLHQNIRCLRKKLKLSQEELAQRIGLNRGNIASYENGSAEPKICNLLKLSHLFGVSILDLTQRDLSRDEDILAASEHFQQAAVAEKEILEKFLDRANELEQVIESIRTCHKFRMEAIGQLPKDLQLLEHNFDQLYDAAQMLLRNHQRLLDLVSFRLK